MKYFNRVKLKSGTVRVVLCAIVSFCLLSACYDDTFDSFRNTGEDSPFITFKLSCDSPDAEAFTRSADGSIPGTIRNIYPLVPEEGGDTLYLIESEINGAYPVSSTSASTRQTRGEKINSSDGLVDDLGLYCFPSPEEGEGKPKRDTKLEFDHWKLKGFDNNNNGVSYPGLYDNKDTEHNNEEWPGYPLDFVVYYPYTEAFKYDGGTYNDADPNDADYRDDLYGWVWSTDRTGLCMHPVPRNEMYLYYKVPDSICHQVDLMADYIQNKESGTCEIKLKHLLTAIRFETGEKLAPCTIKKIAISGVRAAGYMDVSKLLNDDKGQWWEKTGTGTGTETGTDTETETGTETGTDTETETGTETGTGNDFIKYLNLQKGSSKRATYTVDYGKDGRVFNADPNNPDGYTVAHKSLLGDESEADNKNIAFFLMPQELEESATLYIELEYAGEEIEFTLKKNIDLKPRGEDRKWTPGTTIIYTLSGELPEIPLADLRLIDGNDMPLKEIKVGYAGGETNYKVASYLNYRDETGGNFKRLPMPWKASIVTLDESVLDENGNPKETVLIEYKFKTTGVGGVDSATKTIKDQDAYDKEFGSVERIEYDSYNTINNNLPDKLADMADNPVKTLVMIPKIVMKKTSSATDALKGAEEKGSETAPFNLAARGIGLAENGLEIFHKNGMGGESSNDWTDFLAREYTNTEEYYGDKDINTANCYIVSAPGWYTIPLVYGNAVKDGCINYSAYVFKSNNHGVSNSSTSKSLNGENQILRYAINHDGNPIQSPYILDGNGIDSTNVEAKLLWEDQVCLIEDVSLVDTVTGDKTQTLAEFYSKPTSR